MGQLDGKVCLITGGAGSIGLATARLFLAEGAKLMLVDLRAADLEIALEQLNAERVITCAADVSDASQVKRYIELTVSTFGKIDVLFSNAGNTGTIAPIADFPEDIFDSVFAVHVKGAFLNCKYGYPQMNDGGSIIITSSVAGVRGDAGVYAYIPAKHAQIGLMRCLAKEAARRNIRVNTINPGPVHNSFQAGIEERLTPVLGRDATDFFNDIIPLRRHGTPDEIARSVLYLASEASTFTTGTTLMVDGGMSV